MQKIIILTGAGQLGSRHLQGLMNMENPACIFVVEPSEKAAETALQRAAQVNSELAADIQFVQSVSQLPVKSADLVIVATNADVRPAVVGEIVSGIDTPLMVLEKVAYQSVQIFEQQIRLLDNASVRAWVNCPRRMYPFYDELKERNAGKTPVSVRVTGMHWGLGCNAVHYIDLWAFLSSGSNLRLTLERLDPVVHESKRKGFSEFTGLLEFQGNGGSVIMESSASHPDPTEIQILVSGRRYIVNEMQGIYESDSAAPGGKQEIKLIRFPYQSGLTDILAAELLETGTCRLPTIGESFIHHSLILPVLTSHYNRVTGSSLDYCPVT